MLVVLFGLMTTPASAQGADRVALVIANSQYRLVPVLRNPAADGRLMAQSLKRAGFGSVELVECSAARVLQERVRS